jgi:Cellulase (glycosyl hydrolase family 5)
MSFPSVNLRNLSVSALSFLPLLLLFAVPITPQATQQKWSTQRATAWYAHQPWPVGSNFIPSTAINELEMWQADTFDLPTIDRELGWAEGVGMNTMRVFLHNFAWKQDRAGFLDRMEKFLQAADKHHIKIMFVLLDSVWDPEPKIGKQREPRPHVHNSGWVQAPGAKILNDPATWPVEIEPYIKEVVGHFRNDRRVLLWDLMNEPDNEVGQYKATELPNKAEAAQNLLTKVWQWARFAKPTQPLTSGVWRKQDYSDAAQLSPMEHLQLENSDVITFHNYDPPEKMQATIHSLRHYNRPILCSEYMARPRGSTFEAILPILKKENVGAYNWGFVSGKSQTIYPWDSWEKEYTAEPPVWFHDIFRPNGQPHDAAETNLIRRLTGQSDGSP